MLCIAVCIKEQLKVIYSYFIAYCVTILLSRAKNIILMGISLLIQGPIIPSNSMMSARLCLLQV